MIQCKRIHCTAIQGNLGGDVKQREKSEESVSWGSQQQVWNPAKTLHRFQVCCWLPVRAIRETSFICRADPAKE
jgi:hypothetical protein